MGSARLGGSTSDGFWHMNQFLAGLIKKLPLWRVPGSRIKVQKGSRGQLLTTSDLAKHMLDGAKHTSDLGPEDQVTSMKPHAGTGK